MWLAALFAGCGGRENPLAEVVDVPLTYADYYYLEALTRLKRRLQS